MTRRYPSPVLPAQGCRVRLPPGTSRHVLVVCRHPRGDVLRLFDGQGGEVQARLVDVEDGCAVVEGLGPARDPHPPHPRVVLVQALLKTAAFEEVLRIATACGVASILPVLSRRTVVRPGRPERWTRILEASARQCGRPDLPGVAPAHALEAVLASPLPAARLVLLPGAAPAIVPEGDRCLLVGPEGGFEGEEVDAILAAGFAPAGLGPWTLPAAAAAAAALARYGWP
ncbi:MAG: 16S rRNA (uracil(1498)-N(3))-methyltransferase [Deltaproteobacteria bacterium]|nr:16S rRNA (uracil(1498)-N(3))-methyltransferase [Deltaproteobacteria bacterium]